MRMVAAAFCAVLLAGCAETPEQGFEAFFAAAAAQDGDKAWDRLTKESRAVLEDLAGRAQATGRGKDMGAKDYLFGVGAGAGLPLTATLRRVEVLEREGDRARVVVVDALGREEKVTMRREEGVWRVDLVATAGEKGRP